MKKTRGEGLIFKSDFCFVSLTEYQNIISAHSTVALMYQFKCPSSLQQFNT